MKKLKFISVESILKKIKVFLNIVYCVWYSEILKIEGEKKKLNIFFNFFWLFWKLMFLLF